MAAVRVDTHRGYISEHTIRTLRRTLAKRFPRLAEPDVEDAVSQAALEVLERANGGDQLDNLAGAIAVKAKHRAIDTLRKRSRRSMVSLDELDDLRTTPPACEARYLLHQAMHFLVGGLTPRAVDALELHLAGVSSREIADFIGTTPGAVDVMNMHTRAKIKAWSEA